MGNGASYGSYTPERMVTIYHRSCSVCGKEVTTEMFRTKTVQEPVWPEYMEPIVATISDEAKAALLGEKVDG